MSNAPSAWRQIVLPFRNNLARIALCVSEKTNNEGGRMMPKHSYYLRQARVCRSLADRTEDPTIRERYERLALDYLERAMDAAECDEENFLMFLTSPRLAPVGDDITADE
jgi:hypothetical protein